jgi:hypothetical protein
MNFLCWASGSIGKWDPSGGGAGLDLLKISQLKRK